MFSNTFLEELSKNRVLIDDNDCLDIREFNKFKGPISLPIKYSLKKYGSICLTVKGLKEYIKLTYLGIILLEIDRDGDYFLPINFVKDECICLEGLCESILVKLYGCKFDCGKFEFLLPRNRVIVYGDSNKTLYEFENHKSLVEQNLSQINEFENCCFVQTHNLSEVCGIGKLYSDNGLKFASSIDGFSTSLLITKDKVQSAIFLQDSIRGLVYFIYLKNSKVFYKVYNEITTILSEEKEFEIERESPSSFVGTFVSCLNNKFFGLVFRDSVSIYVIKNETSIEKVFDGVADGFDLYEYENLLIVYLFRNNSITRLEFLYNLNTLGANILVVEKSKVFQNLISVLEYNNSYIYSSSSGYKGLINIDE